jgi:hypothetical protein
MSISAIYFLFLSTYIYDLNLQNIALSMKKKQKKRAIRDGGFVFYSYLRRRNGDGKDIREGGRGAGDDVRGFLP